MLTDVAAAELMARPRCTYPSDDHYGHCMERSDWVGRCQTCGNSGDGFSDQTVCGEHRFVLSGELDFVIAAQGLTCRVCSEPLRILWEQL